MFTIFALIVSLIALAWVVLLSVASYGEGTRVGSLAGRLLEAVTPF